jgi:signal transduction histidine kinase
VAEELAASNSELESVDPGGTVRARQEAAAHLREFIRGLISLRSQNHGVDEVDALVDSQPGLAAVQRSRLHIRVHAVAERMEPSPAATDKGAKNGAGAENPLSAYEIASPAIPSDPAAAAGRGPESGVLMVSPGTPRMAVTTVLHVLVAKALEEVGADLCQIYIEEDSALTLRAEAPAEGSAISGPRTLNRRNGVAILVSEPARAVAADPRSLTGAEAAWAQRGFDRMAVVGVGSPGDDGSGILVVARSGIRPFTDVDLAVLDRLALEVSQAIGSADLLSRAEELAVLKERMKLAREIHDGLASDLSAVVALFKYHDHRRRSDPAEADKLLEQIRDLVDGSLRSARDILATLRPRHQPPADLAEAVRRQVEDFANTYGITAVARIDGSADDVGAEERDTLYSILRESLTNVRKHSQATALEVRLDLRARPYVLAVEDDGVGIDMESLDDKFGSFGLVGMRERTELLGGSIEIGNGPMGGAQIVVRGPEAAPRRV